MGSNKFLQMSLRFFVIGLADNQSAGHPIHSLRGSVTVPPVSPGRIRVKFVRPRRRRVDRTLEVKRRTVFSWKKSKGSWRKKVKTSVIENATLSWLTGIIPESVKRPHQPKACPSGTFHASEWKWWFLRPNWSNEPRFDRDDKREFEDPEIRG